MNEAMLLFSKKYFAAGRSAPSLGKENVNKPAEEDQIPNYGARMIGKRRRLKSALYFAYWTSLIFYVLAAHCAFHPVYGFSTGNRSFSQRKHDWIERSVQYYSTVMRRSTGQKIVASAQSDSSNTLPEVQLTIDTPQKNYTGHDKEFIELATKHYYARFLIKVGKWSFAEKIYRKIIYELTSSSEEDCDHTKLAVSTLLLALHMQRTGDVKATRAVFLGFFRRVAVTKDRNNEDHKCSCSAKVLQAYALFEMKNGHSAKSLEIIQRAVEMDEKLRPVLEWKQFRDAAAGRPYSPNFRFKSNCGK